jgi:glycosyltransferase 2 family protein
MADAFQKPLDPSGRPAVSIFEADPADRPGPGGGGRPRLLSVSGLLRLGRSPIFRALFVATVLVLLAVTLAQRGPGLWDQIGHLSLPVVALAFLAGLGGLMSGLMLWRSLLADLGSRLSVGDAVRVMFIGQLAKYIPGSVWPILAQAELAHDRGVPRTRTGVSVLLSSAVLVCTGGFVAAVTLPFASTASTRQYLWIMLAAPVALILLTPPVLNRSLRLVLRLLRRSSLYQPATWRGIATSTGWAILTWCLYGIMIYVLTARLAGHGDLQILAVAIAGSALSWVAGFLFVIAPAGAGVRDAMLVAVVNVATTGTVAITVALVARGLAVVADAVAGAAATALVGHRRLQALRSASQPAPDESNDDAGRPIR